MVIMNFKEKEWSYSCEDEEELSENKKCCSYCKTTKTPLWRGGPAGPKTLCNACGIRYRKRRAANSTVGMNKGDERKGERPKNHTNDSAKTVDDVVGGSKLSKSLKVKLIGLGDEVLFQHSTSVVKKPRTKLGEEEQAAVCLMALSCGFVFALKET